MIDNILKLLVCNLIKLKKFILIIKQINLFTSSFYTPPLLFRRRPPQSNYLSIIFT